MNDRIVDTGIGGADASSGAHGDYEEEAAVVREESQHAVIGGKPLHDQVNALGKRMMMLGPLSGQLVVLVDERARSVDKDFGSDLELASFGYFSSLDRPDIAFPLAAERFNIVGGDAATAQRGADE